MTSLDPYHQRIERRTSLTKALFWFLLALVLAALAMVADSQSLPEAPKPQHDRTEMALLAADAASRALDVYSTRRALAQGSREALLPSAIAGHTWSMAAYSTGTVALDWFAARQLERRGHRKLAQILTLIDLGQDAPWAIHNLFLTRAPQTQKPGNPKLPIRKVPLQ